MSVRSRRAEVTCPFFGIYSDLDLKKLPTIKDAIKCILHTRKCLKEINNGKKPPSSEVLIIVVKKIEKIWESASIPIVSHTRVSNILKANYNAYLKLIRFPDCKKNSNYDEKVANFISNGGSKLFDIAACKCTSYDSCTCVESKKGTSIRAAVPHRSEKGQRNDNWCY